MPKKQQPINVPKGEIIEDLIKKKWIVGDSIAQGGFGAIYEVSGADSRKTNNPYVVKFEPFENGPLFIEKKFYIVHLKSEDVQVFKKKKNIKTIGLPCYITTGSHEVNDRKLRFLIVEKLGKDLGTIFEENNGTFPTTTVFKIAVQLLDVLEYIHERGYVHADIKARNILMGISEGTKNKQVYLVDFGLCTKFSQDETFTPNPKRAHDGTLEYLSRDAHLGVPTRRGDLEILAYNIIEWLGCTLPWKKIKNKNTVYQTKESYMSDIPKFMKDCFRNKETIPNALVKYLEYLNTLDFNAAPDYKKIKNILLSGVSKSDSIDKPLQFSAIGTPTSGRAENDKVVKREKKTKRGTAANNEETENSKDVDREKKPRVEVSANGKEDSSKVMERVKKIKTGKAAVETEDRGKITKKKSPQNKKKVVGIHDGPAKRTRLAVKNTD